MSAPASRRSSTSPRSPRARCRRAWRRWRAWRTSSAGPTSAPGFGALAQRPATAARCRRPDRCSARTRSRPITRRRSPSAWRRAGLHARRWASRGGRAAVGRDRLAWQPAATGDRLCAGDVRRAARTATWSCGARRASAAMPALDYLAPAEVKRLIAAGAVLPPRDQPMPAPGRSRRRGRRRGW